VAQTSEATTSAGQHYGDSNSPGQSPGSPMQLSPSLDESQIARLATSAKELVQRLPQYQPKAQTAKRKTNKELEVSITNFIFTLWALEACAQGPHPAEGPEQ
jgi:hypothetical protein